MCIAEPRSDRPSRPLILLSAILLSLTCLFGCADSSSKPQSPSATDAQADKQVAASPATDSDATDSGKAGNDRMESRKTPTDETSASQPAADAEPSGPDSPPAFTFVAPPLTEQEIQDGWVSLFDGVSLFGWQPNSETHWFVEDGVIVADGDVPGLLLTPYRVADFEFRCDFLLEAGGNSGIFLRTAFTPENPAQDCYELNICDTHDSFPTASFVARERVKQDLQTDGSWHTMFVRAVGPQLTVQLDGETVMEFTDESEYRLDAGRIGLQMNGGRIQFRNVCLRPLGLEDLLDAELTQWREVPGNQAEFTMADGTLEVRGGQGFLESQQEYANFALQLQARTGEKDVNSGVFFRTIAGTQDAPSNGYELQICNQFADGDRTRPNEYGTGFGTGAIFRRAKVRWVVPDDLEWFTMTLIADGDHFASWVDGYPVVSWQDMREPDENPRKGRRLKPGHLSLQAHDPGTQIAFRQVRIAPLP